MSWHTGNLKHRYDYLYISLDLKVFQEYLTSNLFPYLSINYLVINHNDFLYIPNLSINYSVINHNDFLYILNFICQKRNYINDGRILNMSNYKLRIFKFFSFQKILNISKKNIFINFFCTLILQNPNIISIAPELIFPILIHMDLD